MDGESSGRRGPPEAWATLLAFASTLATVWLMMDPQQRYWTRLQILGTVRNLAARLAWRTGHRAMADELAGQDFQRYQVAYWLSRGRDRAAAALNGMRP